MQIAEGDGDGIEDDGSPRPVFLEVICIQRALCVKGNHLDHLDKTPDCRLVTFRRSFQSRLSLHGVLNGFLRMKVERWNLSMK